MLGIRKEFPGVVALADVDLRLRPGTIHALVGENGAGKSTLMNCVFGLVAPDAGRIVLDGQDIVVPSPRAALDAGISMIQQELHPIPARSVMENIWLGRFPTRRIAGLSFVDHRRMATDTASRCWPASASTSRPDDPGRGPVGVAGPAHGAGPGTVVPGAR